MPDENTNKNIRFRKELLHPKHFGGWVILFVAAILNILPQRLRHWVGGQIGTYLFRHHAKRRHIVETNLKQVFPDVTESQLQQMVHDHLSWYGKALVDYGLFFFGSKKRLQKQVAIVGEELLAHASDNKRPLILFLAHSVMLEFAVVALSINYKSFGSYKASSNPVLDWMIARSRCRFADFVVSRDDGLRPLIRSIKSQRIMIFLPDEDLGLDNAVFSQFFGRQKATLTTPARLTRLAGATAVAGFVTFDQASRQYKLQLQAMPSDYPKGDAALDALALNQALESLILQSSEQYLWVMKCYRTVAPQDQALY